MLIKNAKILQPDGSFAPGDILTRGEIIEKVTTAGTQEDFITTTEENQPVIDAAGAYILPGLIDIHIHGCCGFDFCDATAEALDAITKYQLSQGITTIAPATLTLPVEQLERVLANAAVWVNNEKSARRDEALRSGNPTNTARRDGTCPAHSDIAGINMEGPFISREKKGAQDERYILPCDVSLARHFINVSENLVKFIGLAPEAADGYREFIEALRGEVHISLAHTNADYDTAIDAIAAGADHAVHLFNAMPEMLHRRPGVPGAVFDSENVSAEIITDGIHVHPSLVRAAFRAKGPDHLILISDSLRATGLPDGQYAIGELEFRKNGWLCTMTKDGAIAGSVTNLADCMRAAVLEMGIPLGTAALAATANPARSLGIYDRVGSIAPRKQADFILLRNDAELSLAGVVKRGVQAVG